MHNAKVSKIGHTQAHTLSHSSWGKPAISRQHRMTLIAFSFLSSSWQLFYEKPQGISPCTLPQLWFRKPTCPYAEFSPFLYNASEFHQLRSTGSHLHITSLSSCSVLLLCQGQKTSPAESQGECEATNHGFPVHGVSSV